MKGITLYSIEYYKKNIFKGSYRGICFYVQKSGDGDDVRLMATAWKGPFAFDRTEEEKISEKFPFSDEGIAMADAWLENVQQELYPACRERKSEGFS